MNATEVEKLGKAIKNCDDIIKYSFVNDNIDGVHLFRIEYEILSTQPTQLLHKIKEAFLEERDALVSRLKGELNS